ncbi:unnamed protein product [Arabis nemorensis]|uniref:Uncharacterized protein n=1 Tax=Arabis nemorensis TaxID=586526 RepID=A0A565C0E4_9BRAS|nr:unnamed protein product [Arabis nemorensis]
MEDEDRSTASILRSITFDVEQEEGIGDVVVANQTQVLGSSVNINQESHHVTRPFGVESLAANATQDTTFGFVIGTTHVLVQPNKGQKRLNNGDILWITEPKAPLGRVEEILGSESEPIYVVRLFPEWAAGINRGVHVVLQEEFPQDIDGAKDTETQSNTGQKRVFSEEESHGSRKKMQNTNIALGSSSNHPGSSMAHVPIASQGFNAGPSTNRPSTNRGREGQYGRARGSRSGQYQRSSRAIGSGSSYMNRQQRFGLQQGMHSTTYQQNQMGVAPDLTDFPAPRLPPGYLSEYLAKITGSHMPTTHPGGPSGSTIPRPELNSNAFPSQPFQYPNHQAQGQMYPQMQSHSSGRSFYQGGQIPTVDQNPFNPEHRFGQPNTVPWLDASLPSQGFQNPNQQQMQSQWSNSGQSFYQPRPIQTPQPTVDQNPFNPQQRFGVPNTVPSHDAFPSQEFQNQNQQQMYPQTQSHVSNVGQYPYQGGRGGRGRGLHE